MHNFLGGWIIKSLGGAFNERDINWEAFRLKIYLANEPARFINQGLTSQTVKAQY